MLRKDGNDRELRSASEETRRLPKSHLVNNNNNNNNNKAYSDLRSHF